VTAAVLPRPSSTEESATHLEPLLVDFPNPKTMAGQMLYDTRSTGKETGKTSPTVRPVSLADGPWRRRGKPSPDGGTFGRRSQSLTNVFKAGLPSRCAFALSASPDAPATDTAIVNGVSSVGWIAHGLRGL
jgi:hypothetical protein